MKMTQEVQRGRWSAESDNRQNDEGGDEGAGSKEVQGKSDAVLKEESVKGVGKMKAMIVSDTEASNIVVFLHTLK